MGEEGMRLSHFLSCDIEAVNYYPKNHPNTLKISQTAAVMYFHFHSPAPHERERGEC